MYVCVSVFVCLCVCVCARPVTDVFACLLLTVNVCPRQVSLMFIGLLTAIVADLASLFGCTIGLTEELTAITFVALGTSLPDTFASKTAAVNDEHADASVGNVTGSNSVNVFLGLGLPWTIATIYHA